MVNHGAPSIRVGPFSHDWPLRAECVLAHPTKASAFRCKLSVSVTHNLFTMQYLRRHQAQGKIGYKPGTNREKTGTKRENSGTNWERTVELAVRLSDQFSRRGAWTFLCGDGLGKVVSRTVERSGRAKAEPKDPARLFHGRLRHAMHCVDSWIVLVGRHWSGGSTVCNGGRSPDATCGRPEAARRNRS
jgi:hypothetical protein